MKKRGLLWIVSLCLGLASFAQSSKTIHASHPSPPTSHLSREYDLMFHEAMVQRQKNNHEAAFDLLQRCLEKRPDASEACFFLGTYYAELPERDDSAFHHKALQLFERAVELEPKNANYLERLAAIYIDDKQYAKATGVVERMYEANKGRQELLDMLFNLYARQKQFDKAVEVLDRLELIDGRAENTTLRKCRLYLDMEEPEKAVSEMKALADHYPNDMTYRTLYANTLLVTGHEDDAYDVLAGVLSEEPGNVRAQQVLRNYFLRKGNEEAADSVNHVILLNPKSSVEDKVAQLRQIIIESEQTDGDSTMVLRLFDDILRQPEPSADLAEMKAAYMQLKEMPRDSVTRAYEYVLTLAPDQASARLRLVQQAWEDENDRRIITLCQAARQYNPEEMAFYYYQGMAYYRQQDTDHALEAFRNGINVITDESNPEIVSDFYAVMGDLLHQKGREAEAFAAYDSSLVWKADNIGCLNNYAYYLSLQDKRLDEAEQMSYRTVKAEPENATYLDTYAWILFMQKRYAEARVYIDQALQHDEKPGAVINEHAGDIYALCGDIDGAVKQWAKALVDDPKNKLLIKKIKQKKYVKK